MPRRNQRKGHPQHSRGLKRPRGWHRKAISPGIKQANLFLERLRDLKEPA